jgi:hypothetical protein
MKQKRMLLWTDQDLEEYQWQRYIWEQKNKRVEKLDE